MNESKKPKYMVKGKYYYLTALKYPVWSGDSLEECKEAFERFEYKGFFDVRCYELRDGIYANIMPWILFKNLD